MTNPLSLAFSALAIGARFVRSCWMWEARVNLETKTSDTHSAPIARRWSNDTLAPMEFRPLSCYGEVCILAPLADVFDLTAVPTVEQVTAWTAEANAKDNEYCHSHFSLGSLSEHSKRLHGFCSPELRAVMELAPGAVKWGGAGSEYESPWVGVGDNVASALSGLSLDAYRAYVELIRAQATALKTWCVEQVKVDAWKREEDRKAIEASEREVARRLSLLPTVFEATPSKGKRKGKTANVFWFGRAKDAPTVRVGLSFADGSRSFYRWEDTSLASL